MEIKFDLLVETFILTALLVRAHVSKKIIFGVTISPEKIILQKEKEHYGLMSAKFYP